MITTSDLLRELGNEDLNPPRTRSPENQVSKGLGVAAEHQTNIAGHQSAGKQAFNAVYDVFGQPVEKVVTFPLSLAGVGIDAFGLNNKPVLRNIKKSADSVAEYFKENDIIADGVDPANPNTADQRNTGTVGEAAEFATAYGATGTLAKLTRYMADKVARRSVAKDLTRINELKDVASKKIAEANTRSSILTVKEADRRSALAMNEVKKATNEASDIAIKINSRNQAKALQTEANNMSFTDRAKSVYGWLGIARESAVSDIRGTIGTSQIYADTADGGAEINQQAGLNFFKEAATEAMFGVAFAIPTMVNKGRKIYGAVEEANAVYNSIHNAKRTWFNIGEDVFKQLEKDIPVKTFEGNVNALTPDLMQEMHANKKYGMFWIPNAKGGDPTSMLFVSPKLGSMILHIDSKTGKYYIKGSDPKYLSTDVVVANNGEAPLFSPDVSAREFSTMQGNTHGYDSLHTAGVNIVPHTAANLDGTGTVEFKNAGAYNKDTLDKVGQWFAESDILPADGVSMKPSMLEMISNNVLAGKNFPVSTLDMYSQLQFRTLTDLIDAERNDRAAWYKKDEINAEYLNNSKTFAIGAFKSFADMNKGKSNPLSPIINTFFNTDGSTTLKSGTSNLFNVAIERAIIRAYSKIEKFTDANGNDIAGIRQENIPDIASLIANEFTNISGLVNTLETQQFTNQLTEALRSKLGKDNFSEGMSTVDVNGETVLIFRDKVGESAIVDQNGNIAGTSVQSRSNNAMTKLFNNEPNTKELISIGKQAKAGYVDSSLSELNRYTSINKSKARIGNQNINMPDSIDGLSRKDIDKVFENFTNMLDGQSMPLHYIVETNGKVVLGNDAMAYMRMANTVYKYRGGAPAALKILDELTVKNDVELAIMLEKDIPADGMSATTLLDAYNGNAEKAAVTQNDVNNLRNEIEGHYILLSNKDVQSKGLTFPVMKVSTTRMQYAGDINPQQGYLSKMLLTSTPAYTFDPKNQTHVNFRADAIRWALDEGPFLDLITDPDIIKQYDLENFKGQKWKGTNEQLNEIHQLIINDPGFKLGDNASLKDRMAFRNLNNLDDATGLLVEYDAITSMQGITNAIYSEADGMTGINSDIAQTGADIYMKVGDKIQQQGMFTFFRGIDAKTARKFAKDPTMEGGYGMDPESIVQSIFDSYINKAWMTGSDADMMHINNDLKNKLLFTMPDFIKFTDDLAKKIERMNISKEVKESLDMRLHELSTDFNQPKSKTLNANRILATFDNLESTVMKIEGGLQDKADIIAQLNLTKDAMKVYSFSKKVDNGQFNNITAKEIEAVSTVLAKHTKGVMGDILDKSFGERFVSFKNIVTKEFAHGNIATMALLHGTKITKQLADKIYLDLGIKKSELKAYKNAFDGNTMHDFIDFLYSKGHDPLTSSTVHDMLPGYYNVFGDKVLYVAAKNSGFSEAGMQYLGLTMINNPLPYVFHSMDASMVGIAARKKAPLNMRWDAFYDIYSQSQARAANKAMAWIYKSNPIDTLSEAYDTNNNIIATYSGSVNMDRVIDDSARRSIVGNGDVLTAEGKQKKINDIKNILYDEGESVLYKNIIKEQALVNDKLADIKDSTSLTMNNYANGRDESAWTGPAGSLKKEDFVTIRGEINYGASSFDTGNLNDINIKNVKIDPTYSFKLLSKNRSDFAMDIGKLTFKDKAEYNSVGRHVTLNTKPSDPLFWKQLSHELIHAVGIKLHGEAGVHKIFGGIKQALEEQGIKVGEYKDGAPRIYEQGKLEANTGLSKIDTDLIYGNELSASMLDNLISNELIYANRGIIAKMQNTNSLKAEPLIMVDKSGRVHELYTVKDFTDFLTAQEINGYADTIKQYTNAVHGIINSSTHVRDIIFDKPKAKFESTLKDTFQRLKHINTAAAKANEIIQETPFLEIFDISKNREVVETTLAMGKGVDKIIYEVLNSVMDGLRKSFETEFGDQAPKFARLYGNAWMMGMNKLFFSDMDGSMRFMNISLNGDLVHNGTMSSFNDIQHRFQRIENEFFNTISGNRTTPDINKAVTRLKQDIKALARGTAGKAGNQQALNVDMLARKIEQFAKRNMDDTTYIDFRLAVQKLASMQIIGKNSRHYDKFKHVYAEVNARSDMFQSYMEHANIHENPNTLFGENVDMQFVESGRTVKAVRQDADVKYASGDVVGTAVLPDGTKFDIITIEAGEKIIAAQQSNLITMELTNMETGVFTQKVGDFTVELNGQRIITEGATVDKSIITQLARNVYARKKEDIAKDLGYRQYQLLRDQRIILTKEETAAIDQASGMKESRFKRMSKNNPIAKALGTDFYYDKRWEHYFEGTKGINVSNLAHRITGGDKQFAGFVENSILGVYNITNVLKRFILIARPQSYINSAISSMIIYMHHANGFTYKRDLAKAKSSIKAYRKLINNYADAVVSKDTAKAEAAWAKVKADSVHKMMEAGLSDTIKADVYKAGTNKEMAGYGAIYRATGSHQYANSVKTLFMSESVPIFKKAGDLFEMTEMIPKLMLYHNKLAALGHQKAATTTIMAFPSYNNLNPALNMLNIVNPYMKFFASTPRMVMYAGNQNIRNLMIGIAIAHGIVPASYAMESDEEMAKYDFYKENGFVKLPFMPIVYPSFSLFPIYKDPFDTPFGNSLFGIDFIPGVAENIFNKDSYLPGKLVED